jgi:hypothetical protein
MQLWQERQIPLLYFKEQKVTEKRCKRNATSSCETDWSRSGTLSGAPYVTHRYKLLDVVFYFAESKVTGFAPANIRVVLYLPGGVLKILLKRSDWKRRRRRY